MIKGAYLNPLQELHSVACESFALAMGVIKPHAEQHPELMAQLQYLDILTQRIEHLVNAHEKVMSLHIDSLFKNSFLHLQFFQFQILEEDLRAALNAVDEYITQNLGDQGLPVFFTSNPTLQGKIYLVRQIILKEAGQFKLVGLPPLTKIQVTICKELYTMASERIVLEWFLTTGTVRNFETLLTYYQQQMQEEYDKSVELF